MRILVNHFSSTPNVITGITAYSWAMTRALSEIPDQEVHLCTNWDADRVPAAVVRSLASITSLPTPRNEARALLRRSLDLPALERKTRCDVVFTPHPVPVLLGRAARVTVVHDLYVPNFPQFYTRRRRLQWRALFPLALRRSDRVICVSQATRDDMLRRHPWAADRSAVVHEAPVLLEGAPMVAQKPGERYMLTVTTTEPTKNVGLLFAALKLLRRDKHNWRCILVGRDRTGQIAQFLARERGIGLTHIPHASEAELIALYRHASCYINTSLAEGFCLPILEAQSQGAPVICSDLPVLREVAGDGALFVDPHSPQMLAEAILRAFTDESWAANMIAQGQRNVARFSWSRAAAEAVSLFEQAVRAHKAGDR